MPNDSHLADKAHCVRRFAENVSFLTRYRLIVLRVSAGWHSLQRPCYEATRSSCLHVQVSKKLGIKKEVVIEASCACSTPDSVEVSARRVRSMTTDLVNSKGRHDLFQNRSPLLQSGLLTQSEGQFRKVTRRRKLPSE